VTAHRRGVKHVLFTANLHISIIAQAKNNSYTNQNVQNRVCLTGGSTELKSFTIQCTYNHMLQPAHIYTQQYLYNVIYIYTHT